ncbi:MAG: hypothetical protein IPM29_24550 [Planctomycetes bacterium]|nr:hypothetical protein [Planctomycetota bacterium]
MHDDPTPPGAAAEPDDWELLTVLHDARLARELLDLLHDARVPCRLLTAGAGGVPEGAFGIAVPPAELPVATGVADRLLGWFRHDAEGDADLDEIHRAFDEPDEPEFRERLAAERRSRGARLSVAGLLVGVGLAGAFGFALWQLARLLGF